MDVSKLARDKSWEFNEIQKNNPHVNHFERGLMTGSFEEGFIKGYNAACEWFPIETANKEENILICHNGRTYIGCWHNTYNLWVSISGTDTLYNAVAWMPLPKYTHKP